MVIYTGLTYYDLGGYKNYHHNSRAHGSSASLAGRLSQSYKTAPGYTSCANTESLCSNDVKTYYKFY